MDQAVAPAKVRLEDARDDVLVAAYIQLRDQKEEIVKRHKEELAAHEKKMDKIGLILLARLQENGQEGFKTPHGTVYKATKVGVKVEDWDSFFQWVLAHEAWQFLDHRVSKTATVEYREANRTEEQPEGDIPPGLSWREWVEVGVRRS